jgi:nicotinamide-nucleotide amidase
VRYREGEEELLAGLFGGLRERHASHIYTESGEAIDELVAELLSGHRIALGESCSGGKLAARLTDRPGSSAYFAGGVVAYSNEAKTELLGVAAELIAAHGAVSPEVGEALADGAMDRFGADLGVGITGVAGPDGGTEEKPVGYVCICVKSGDGRVLARDPKLPGSRDDVRDRSVSVAMHMIRRHLLGEDLPF